MQASNLGQMLGEMRLRVAQVQDGEDVVHEPVGVTKRLMSAAARSSPSMRINTARGARWPKVVNQLREHHEMTASELFEAIAGSRKALSVMLTVRLAAGDLLVGGKRGKYRYRLAE